VCVCLGGGDHTIAAGRITQTEACNCGAVAIWIIVTHFLLQVHHLSTHCCLEIRSVLYLEYSVDAAFTCSFVNRIHLSFTPSICV
jgi:hypothetical protein